VSRGTWAVLRWPSACVTEWSNAISIIQVWESISSYLNTCDEMELPFTANFSPCLSVYTEDWALSPKKLWGLIRELRARSDACCL
jgi:hypothetical protein